MLVCFCKPMKKLLSDFIQKGTADIIYKIE